MNRITTITISILLSVIAIAAPSMTAIKLAEEQSVGNEMAHLRMLTADIMRRGDAITSQHNKATDALIKDQGNAPCSANKIRLMGSLSVRYRYLLALAYIENDRLMCSSLGSYGDGIPLGRPDYMNSQGTRIWMNAELPFAPNYRFTISSKLGYAAIISREPSLDVAADNESYLLAAFDVRSKQLITARGFIKPEWLNRYAGQDELSFDDGEYLVAIKRSKSYHFAALAAISDTHVRQAENRSIKVLLPIGLLVGCLMVALILFLSKRRLSLQGELQTALNKGEFFLLYQPVIDLATGHCSGAEALLRWQRGDGKVISPDTFIPVAESTGMIQAVTEEILRMIERDVPKLLERHPKFYIGINLSSQDLQSDKILRLITGLLSRSGIPAQNLMVEATERGFVNTDMAQNVVQGLRDLGLSVAIDDFGTGYSSLSRLASFNLNYLKIDKLFVDTIGTDAPTSQVAMHIINMSKSLNLEMVAEGVETEAQASFLREQGVRYAQGWLFAKAMPIEALADYIDSRIREAV